MNTKSLKYVLLVTTSLLASLSAVGTANAAGYDCNSTGGVGGYDLYCELPTGGGAGGSAKHTENRIYSGFIWELFGDQGLIPEFIIGVRSLQVKDNDDVNGADASFRIRYQDKLSPDSLRLAYVGGKRDIMGNLGAGYSFSDSSWLATAALEGPYTRLSTDYLLAEGKFKYYAELNTLAKPARVMRPSSGGTCDTGAGYHLTPVTSGGLLITSDPGNGGTVDPNSIENGYTCYYFGG